MRVREKRRRQKTEMTKQKDEMRECIYCRCRDVQRNSRKRRIVCLSPVSSWAECAAMHFMWERETRTATLPDPLDNICSSYKKTTLIHGSLFQQAENIQEKEIRP